MPFSRISINFSIPIPAKPHRRLMATLIYDVHKYPFMMYDAFGLEQAWDTAFLTRKTVQRKHSPAYHTANDADAANPSSAICPDLPLHIAVAERLT
jgi:hypothetical protein